jgi:ABC-2 type transport system permease protein
LARGILRRDRLRLAIWLVAVPAVTLPAMSAYTGTFETSASAQARAAVMATPTGTVFGGPGYGLAHYTTGAMVANELLLYLDVVAALAAILLLVHATRHEEEEGRLELVGATAVGRQAPLAAALGVVAAEVTAIGLVVGLGCLLYPDLRTIDSLALGLAVAATGLAFVGLAAVAAQVAGTGRGAAGLAAAALAASFLLRAAGDTATVQGDAVWWLSWLSPLGWANRMRLFVDIRWWPLLIPLAFALATGAVAWFLAARRDQGEGLLAQRVGSPGAESRRIGIAALVWRRTRGAALGWGLGGLTLVLAMGPAVGSLRGYILDNPSIGRLLGVSGDAGVDAVVEAFSALVTLYAGLFMAAYAISALGSLRSDELAGRSALLLAEPVRRGRLLGLTAFTVAAVALLAATAVGIAFGLAVWASRAVDLTVAIGVAAAMARAFPALIVTVALAAFLIAACPRYAALSWVPVGYAFFHAILGQGLGWPDWTRYLSPFSALPLSPAADVSAAPVVILLGVALVLVGAARQAYARRDLLA